MSACLRDCVGRIEFIQRYRVIRLLMRAAQWRDRAYRRDRAYLSRDRKGADNLVRDGTDHNRVRTRVNHYAGRKEQSRNGLPWQSAANLPVDARYPNLVIAADNDISF